MTHQQIPYFIHQKSIRSTSERSHLYKLNILSLCRTPFRSLQDTVRIRPLSNKMRIIRRYIHLTHQIIRYHIHSHIRKHIRDFVLYQRIGMIRTSGKHDSQSLSLSSLLQYVFVIIDQCINKRVLFAFRFLECLLNRPIVHAQTAQIFTALFKQQIPVFESYCRGINRYTFGLHTFDNLRITCHNRTIITVLFHPFSFENNKRHKNPVDLLFYQVLNMTMYQLSRKADIVRHHHTRIVLILSEIGRIRQTDLYATGSEKSVPEWIFLVHIQTSGDSDNLLGCCNLCAAMKQKLFFLPIDIQTFPVTALSIRENFLAPVSRIITFAAFELVTNDQTTIIATLAI